MEYCQATYPVQCDNATWTWDVEATCDVATPDVDWSGSFSVTTGDECLTPPTGDAVGCAPPCDTDSCNCMSGTLDITQWGDNGTLTMSVEMSAMGTETASRVSGTFFKNGDSGLTAYGSFDGIDVVYDVERIGNTILFLDRPNEVCQQSATISSSSTDYLASGLICGAAGAGAIAFAVFCFCNPCKKKKKQDIENGINNPNAQRPVSAPYTALAGDGRRK